MLKNLPRASGGRIRSKHVRLHLFIDALEDESDCIWQLARDAWIENGQVMSGGSLLKAIIGQGFLKLHLRS